MMTWSKVLRISRNITTYIPKKSNLQKLKISLNFNILTVLYLTAELKNIVQLVAKGTQNSVILDKKIAILFDKCAHIERQCLAYPSCIVLTASFLTEWYIKY